MMNYSDMTSPEAKAKRVRSARMLTGLNRKEFEQKHNIHSNTLKSWENPLSDAHGGLTEKGAKRFIEALRKESIICSIEWLLTGKGEGPKLLQITGNEPLEIPPIAIDQDEAILKETQFFLDINPDAIILLVTDNKMAPSYQVGDYVGGYKRTAEEFDQFINKDCIVEADSDEKYICRYFPSKLRGLYHIIFLNEDSLDHLVKIKSIAPIIWYRRKDKIFNWRK